MNVEQAGTFPPAESRPSLLDVDLAVTPANHHPPHQASRDRECESVSTAWTKFPELEMQLLSPRYTRLARNICQYEGDAGFSAEIRVDDLGLVVTYPGGWELGAALQKDRLEEEDGVATVRSAR